MRLTIPAISGRSVHTIALSPPGPSGMSIRATGEVYASARGGALVPFEVLQLDEQRHDEADVRTRERVVVGRALRRARVHVDHGDPLVARLPGLRLVDDRLQLRERGDLHAEVVHR